MNAITFKQLIAMRLDSVARTIKCWWLRVVESHYMMSGEVEDSISLTAQKNASYYYSKAAMARAKLSAALK